MYLDKRLTKVRLRLWQSLSYLNLAKIVTAAVYSDAQHIEEGVYGLKTRAHDLAQADAAECAA